MRTVLLLWHACVAALLSTAALPAGASAAGWRAPIPVPGATSVTGIDDVTAATTSTGRTAVLSVDACVTGAGTCLNVRLRERDGTWRAAQTLASVAQANNLSAPSVVAARERIVVGWVTYDPDTLIASFATSVLEDGATSLTAPEVLANAPRIGIPRLAAADRSVFAAWAEATSVPPDTPQWLIKAARFDGQWRARTVSSALTDIQDVHVGGSAGERALVAWSGEAASEWRVRATEWTGTAWTSEVPISAPVDRWSRPSTWIDEVGNAAIAYRNASGPSPVLTIATRRGPSDTWRSRTASPLAPELNRYLTAAGRSPADALVAWSAAGNDLRVGALFSDGTGGTDRSVLTAGESSDGPRRPGLSLLGDGRPLLFWTNTGDNSPYRAARPEASGSWTASTWSNSSAYPWVASNPGADRAPDLVTVGIVDPAQDFAAPYALDLLVYDVTAPTIGDISTTAAPIFQGDRVALTVPAPSDQWESSTPVTWDFGDGSTGQGLALEHAWSQPGTYTVRATATDAVGNSASTTARVEILATPAAGVRFTELPRGDRLELETRRDAVVKGRLVDASGAPVSAATVSASIRTSDASTALSPVTTSADGRFTISLNVGRRGTLTLAYRPTERTARFDSTASVELDARARLALRCPKSVRSGRKLRIDGDVLVDGLTKRGAPVVIEVKVGKRWRTVDAGRSTGAGRFAWSQRIRQLRSYRFRARTLADAEVPAAPGTSTVCTVRVRR